MKKTQVTPVELFNLIKHVPDLFAEFRKECWVMPLEEGFESTPEPKYNHELGLDFLKKYDIPSTKEDLYEDGRYTYTSVIDGNTLYNGGQLVVLFSDTIYKSGDMNLENTWIMEVMDDFEFDATKPLVAMHVEDIRIALKEHLDRGIIKLHRAAGIRMYDHEYSYKFADKINNRIKENGKA